MWMKKQHFLCAVIILCLLTACGNEKPQVSRQETDMHMQEQSRKELKEALGDGDVTVTLTLE